MKNKVFLEILIGSDLIDHIEVRPKTFILVFGKLLNRI